MVRLNLIDSHGNLINPIKFSLNELKICWRFLGFIFRVFSFNINADFFLISLPDVPTGFFFQITKLPGERAAASM